MERVQRTLQGLIYRHLQATKSSNYTAALSQLVWQYNTATHSAIGMSPLEAEKPVNFRQVRLAESARRAKVRRPPSGSRSVDKHLQVGQTVRISANKTAFWRSYRPQNVREIFVIARKLTNYKIPLYELSDLSGQKLTGYWYGTEITAVNIP